MTSPYVEVSITAEGELSERLIGLLSQLGFEGFWEDGGILRCFMSSQRWTSELLPEIETLARSTARSSNSPVPHVQVCSVEHTNWNEEWEKTIKPIQVTRRLVIKPTWHEYDATPDQIVLTIDPKMSFGTGYHESTRLSLRLIEKHMRDGTTVLDVGTGTGVLAIAALKLGASSAVAVDNDEWSYANALENARLNDVTERITLVHGQLEDVPQSQFDIIVANIQRSVLEPLLPLMKDRLASDGTIILSGLLTSDEEPMLQALHANSFRVIEELQENEWVALAAYPHL